MNLFLILNAVLTSPNGKATESIGIFSGLSASANGMDNPCSMISPKA